MSSSQNSPIFLFIVGRPWFPSCFNYSQELKDIWETFVCSQPCKNTVQIKLSAKSSCFIQNYPVCQSVYLSVWENKCVSNCAALWPCTLPAHVSLFILTSCQRDNGSLWDCLLCSFSMFSLASIVQRLLLVLISSVMFITPQVLHYRC